MEVGGMLLRVLEEPQNLVEHFKNEAGAIILKMTYGYSIEKGKSDPMVRLVDRMMANFSEAFMPLAWPVDAIPALKYLPEWLPGMSFKQTARDWSLINHLTANVPYSFTKQEMTIENYQPSLVSRMIDECSKGDSLHTLHHLDEEGIKWASATLYGGGADTTVSSLASFVLAMLKYPEIQLKAQEEIDRVVGQERLPQFEDRDNLPYVEAVFKETLRWFPVAPLGVPHSADEDIEYNGYLIPKGTVLVPNIWWFTHDPQVFKDPEVFDPTRHLSPRDEPDPRLYIFGFGRRRCPGRLVAESSLFLSVAQLLASFNMDKALDEKGFPIDPQLQATPGTVSHPHEFPYSITPRSDVHRDLIRKAGKESNLQHSDSSKLPNVASIEDAIA